MRFPTMWYVRPTKPQISLRILAVWSEPLQVAWVFYDCKATDWTPFEVSKLIRRLQRLIGVYTCQNATLLEISCTDSYLYIFKERQQTHWWPWGTARQEEPWLSASPTPSAAVSVENLIVGSISTLGQKLVWPVLRWDLWGFGNFVCLIWFFTSHQQSFSYIGTGLPGLNQY